MDVVRNGAPLSSEVMSFRRTIRKPPTIKVVGAEPRGDPPYPCFARRMAPSAKCRNSTFHIPNIWGRFRQASQFAQANFIPYAYGAAALALSAKHRRSTRPIGRISKHPASGQFQLKRSASTCDSAARHSTGRTGEYNLYNKIAKGTLRPICELKKSHSSLSGHEIFTSVTLIDARHALS